MTFSTVFFRPFKARVMPAFVVIRILRFDTLRRLTGNTTTQLRFGAIEYRSNEAMDIQVHSEPLRKLGWSPSLTLEEGLALTIESERKAIT